MKLPNGERAVIDERELTGYSLDPGHDEGRYKAHLFESLLGITVDNADVLLREAATSCEAAVREQDRYGQRYLIDFEFTGPNWSATIRSAWIVRHDEDFPRLVTCFIL